jgi:hypothetical protein
MEKEEEQEEAPYYNPMLSYDDCKKRYEEWVMRKAYNNASKRSF